MQMYPNLEEHDVFRQEDGTYLQVMEVFPDGWAGCDIAEYPFGLPIGWQEVSPDYLHSLVRIPSIHKANSLAFH